MIMQFLRRQAGKNVALRDVPNLVSKLKEARRGQTKAVDRLELVLRNFCRGKGNTAMIYGQYVQHSSMENECAECLSDALNPFKTYNNTWNRVRVIISLSWTMTSYLRGEAARRDYGVIDREKVEDAVYLMLNMQPEEEYDTGFKHLYYVVEGKQIPKDEDIPEPVHPFLRLVAAWGHRKDALKPTMAMDECVDTLVFLQSIAEME
ncbi:hypothetical protein PI124_g11596 [Phytophthora idaei]|nr:hypothetical protein PI124_g11596 [Phytophthora idaei]